MDQPVVLDVGLNYCKYVLLLMCVDVCVSVCVWMHVAAASDRANTVYIYLLPVKCVVESTYTS